MLGGTNLKGQGLATGSDVVIYTTLKICQQATKTPSPDETTWLKDPCILSRHPD